MKNKEWWFERATSFVIDVNSYSVVTIELRDYTTHTKRWVCCIGKDVLGKDNKFHYEPNPSNRSQEFIELTRFDTLDEVYDAWVKFKESDNTDIVTISDEICKECGSTNAIFDYNGHGHWCCEKCYDYLSRQFDEEYR